MPVRLNRRNLLGLTAAAATPLLAGCGDDESTPQPVSDAREPRRGGTLTGAFAGGGPAESLDPFSAASPADYARNRSIYDVLFWSSPQGVVPTLATAATAAADGTAFTLTLRDGVRWHDGSAFGAADVAYTLRYLTAPERRYPSELAGYLDTAGISVLDARTLRVPLKRPIGDPAALLAANQVFVLKDGTASFTPGDVVGTGPFKVTEFSAGRSSTLQRFDDHWAGAPHLDRLVVLSVNDAQARVNAVRSGQADFAAALPYTEAKKVGAGGQLQVRRAEAAERTAFGFMLNMTRAPFTDPRARQAVRLGVDRQAMVDTVLLGYGEVGNDLFGAGSQYFADDLRPPARDVDAARRLIRDAGAEGMPVSIRSAEIESGYNASATLLAEQLKEIGLRAAPQVVTPAEFFDVKALPQSHIVTFAIYAFPLQAIYTRTALQPSLKFSDTSFDQAVATALASTSDADRVTAWRAVQRAMHERGNWVVWGLADTLSLVRSNVQGIEGRGAAKYPYLGKAWMA